jgi:4,5-DOPA dioxygenase extradiol
LAATRTVPLIYDFSGFPRPLYAVKYAAPGAPVLAQRVRALLKPLGGVKDAPNRGLDHGAWVPLVWMARDADVPVLQLSLPAQDGPALVNLGRALAPLRDQGVVILASGNLTHNLRAIDMRPGAKPPAWAADHDAWLADVLARRDLDALTDFRRRAPALQQNHPTLEHFTPILVAAGAAAPAWSAAKFPVTGWDAGSLSRRCVELS